MAISDHVMMPSMFFPLHRNSTCTFIVSCFCIFSTVCKSALCLFMLSQNYIASIILALSVFQFLLKQFSHYFSPINFLVIYIYIFGINFGILTRILYTFHMEITKLETHNYEIINLETLRTFFSKRFFLIFFVVLHLLCIFF